MSINLAPNHKQGLVVPNPVLLAGGSVGYGEAIHRGTKTHELGGIVVGPVMHHSRAGEQPPRLVELSGGLVLNTGRQNRGIASMTKRFARAWARLGCPIIVQIADAQPDALTYVLERLMLDIPLPDVIDGIELLLPELADEERTHALVGAATRSSDYPIWVKLPLQNASALAAHAVAAGADALVIGQPPAGAGLSHSNESDAWLQGLIYGTIAFPQMFSALCAVAALELSCPLIACGGIHTRDQAHSALKVGAAAIQIDSAVWVEPGLPQKMVRELA